MTINELREEIENDLAARQGPEHFFEATVRLSIGSVVAEDATIVETLSATAYSHRGEPIITLEFISLHGEIRPERWIRHCNSEVLRSLGEEWAVPLLAVEHIAQTKMMADPAVIVNQMVGNGRRQVQWWEGCLACDHCSEAVVTVPWGAGYKWVTGLVGTAASRWIVVSPDGELVMGGRKSAKDNPVDFCQPGYEHGIERLSYAAGFAGSHQVLLSPNFEREVRARTK